MANPVYTPQMLRSDIRGTFIEALMAPRAPSVKDLIATVINSTKDKENYGWLSEVYPMEEFVDSLNMQPLTDTGNEIATGSDDRGYEVKNKTYAGSLCLRRDDLADDVVGGLAQRVKDLAARALYKHDSLLIEKLVAGTSDYCYLQVGTTPEVFFSATHAARGKQTATWSNLLTGSGVTTAYCASDISSAVAALYNMTDEAAEPINQASREIFVLYPPALNKPIREAVQAGIVSNTSNVQFSDQNVKLIQEPRLTATSAVDYYVGISDAEVRGMVWQDREGISMEEVGPGSDTWTTLRQVIYATFLRGAPAYGRPQRLVLVNNT